MMNNEHIPSHEQMVGRLERVTASKTTTTHTQPYTTIRTGDVSASYFWGGRLAVPEAHLARREHATVEEAVLRARLDARAGYAVVVRRSSTERADFRPDPVRLVEATPKLRRAWDVLTCQCKPEQEP